jgi:leucyl aminopeptidase
MPIRITAKTPRTGTRPCRLYPLLKGQLSKGNGSLLAGLPAGVRKTAQALAALRGFEADAEQTLLLFEDGVQWLLAGLGPEDELTPHGFSTAVGRGLNELTKAGAGQIALHLPEGLPFEPAQAARLATEGLAMAAYTFDVYRKPKANGAAPVGVVIKGPGGEAALRRGVDEGLAVAAGIGLCRDLINHPAGVAHPGFMVAEARKLAKQMGATARVIQGEQLRRQGYEAIHAVGAAAAHPPALVALEYGKPRKGKPTLVLVGKGVTFDSGGLDLKPSSAMALMKKDMGGAATTLGAFRAVAGLKLPLHLVAVVGLAENAVGPLAYRPGDVLRTKAGPTVEVTNTDAEGRIVLADAMALAHTYAPTHMIDFATLTGACRIALGKDVMGLFCDDAPLRALLQDAAEASGDALWPLPLWQPYRKQLNSAVADMVNATTGGFGGAITAALFLQEFAGDVAWAHLDCYAWSDGEHPLFPKGGNGVGVRLIADVATRLSKGTQP